MQKMTASGPGRAKVCFVTSEYPPDWGGVSKSAKRVVGLLANAGFEVHVFAPDRGNGSGQLADAPPGHSPAVHLHRVSLKRESGEGAVIPFVNAMYEVDRRVHFDIFHGFFLPSAYPCLALPDRGDRPVVASIRGDDAAGMLSAGPFKDAVHTVLKRASWITSVSTDSLLRAQEIADISKRSSFIPNSIDARREELWSLGPKNKGVVGTVCTFRPKKDIPALVRSYAAVPRELRKRLLLVGDYFEGDTVTRESIESTLSRCNLGDEPEITGYVDNSRISSYLLGMNVFVLSSLHEGFPNTILEAAALGLPIVATAVDGVKDIYGMDSGAAMLAPAGDIAALGKAIETILADDMLAGRLSEASLKIAARFSLDVEQKAWVELYEKLLSHRPAR